MDLDRARAIADVAKVVIDSAKVEVEMVKVTGQASGSGFMPLSAPEERQAIPPPVRN